MTGFSRDYNTPDGFRAGLETRDDINSPASPRNRASAVLSREDGAEEEAARQLGQELLASLLADADWAEAAERSRADRPFGAQQLHKKKKSQRELERAEVSQLMRAAEDEAKEVPEEILAEEQAVEGAPGRAYTEGGLVFLPDQETPREYYLFLWKALRK